MTDSMTVWEDQLIQQMQPNFERAMREVARAVNQAPDGQWIDASEEPVREAMSQLRQEVYQQMLQARLNEAQASFFPSAQ